MLHGVWLPSHPNDITIDPRHDGSVSKDADVVLFDLKQVEREGPLRHIREECGLRPSGAIRFYMGAMVVDDLMRFT